LVQKLHFRLLSSSANGAKQERRRLTGFQAEICGDIVGPLPREISTPTTLVGFVSSHAKDPAAANALLAYLSSPAAAAVYKKQGMQPGR
jgi:ABC-type molybdate transport system substrate-binding protein